MALAFIGSIVLWFILYRIQAWELSQMSDEEKEMYFNI